MGVFAAWFLAITASVWAWCGALRLIYDQWQWLDIACMATFGLAVLFSIGAAARLSVEGALMGDAHDPVNHPSHYNWLPNGVQPCEITDHLMYNRGCAVKYLVRAGKKADELEDLRKASWYLDREIARLEARA